MLSMVPVEHRQEDQVARLILDAPPMNILGHEMVMALSEALEFCHRDPSVRAVVIEGAGSRAFSAGSDLEEVKDRIAAGRQAILTKFKRDEAMFQALATLSKPTFCAIEGLAFGGGLELAVCCDFVVAADDAKFALPEIKLGAFPGSGGTVRVTRRIGLARARRMMLFGDSIDAATAFAWGLIDDVTKPGAAGSTAFNLARQLALGPAQAIAGCRESLVASQVLSERDALALAQRWAIELAFSQDLAEGLQAFQERRPAIFAPR